MAYFSNGIEQEGYSERYCEKCVHGQDIEKGCPVMDAHFLYGYDLCNEKEHPGKVILEMLIPTKGVYPAKCAMFHRTA